MIRRRGVALQEAAVALVADLPAGQVQWEDLGAAAFFLGAFDVGRDER